jgi:hypothetical protein
MKRRHHESWSTIIFFLPIPEKTDASSVTGNLWFANIKFSECYRCSCYRCILNSALQPARIELNRDVLGGTRLYNSRLSQMCYGVSPYWNLYVTGAFAYSIFKNPIKIMKKPSSYRNYRHNCSKFTNPVDINIILLHITECLIVTHLCYRCQSRRKIQKIECLYKIIIWST